MTVTQAQGGEALAPDAHAEAQGAPPTGAWCRLPGRDWIPRPPIRTRLAHAARLQVLPAWQERLKLLSHHDPEYAYDPGHEYQEDWTTDADYRRDGGATVLLRRGGPPRHADRKLSRPAD